MKIRQRFISNSSSCSFTIYKYEIVDDEVQKKILDSGFLVMDNEEDVAWVNEKAQQLGGRIEWEY